jgi:sodium/potassium-transporting ATPase subunit alpha
MGKFKDMLPSDCTVIRDGQLLKLPAGKLVRGDLVELADGERIPADLRIVYSNDMHVDNSSITGETTLLERVPDDTCDDLLEAKNVALFGTYCKIGRGRGIVISIGAQTYLGSVAEISQHGKQQKSPLQIEMDYFVLLITIIACSLGVIFMVVGRLVIGYSYLDCALFGIGIIVANVPEGILACVTISLAITAKKLAEKHVLVKNLESVETLGSTSCICSDKTGTLTMNKMVVNNFWHNGNKHDALDGPQLYKEEDSMKRLLHCSILSS